MPAFTSPGTATATGGSPFTFQVVTAAASATNVTRSGALPAGLAFTNDGNGTATIAGTPTSGGLFHAHADRQEHRRVRDPVVRADRQPAACPHQRCSATATVGSPFSYAVSTSGYPIPSLTQPGSLPSGLSFTDNGNGTGTIFGTPDAGTGGIYPITIAATNPLGSSSQAFTLTVRQPPTITSPASAQATHGTASSFNFTTSGYPTPTLTHTGTVAGLTWTNNGNGAATLAGTPKTAGTYTLTITAANNSGTTSQTFVLTTT